MFFRSKPVGSYRYLQIVHSVREGKKVAEGGKANIYDIQPQMWTYEKDKYRAVVCIPGHLYDTFSMPNYRAILLRSIAWAGQRANVDEYCKREEIAALTYPPGGPQRPEDTLKALEIHPDFTLKLIAAEPLITKPMNFDWDAKGRLWVAETPEYPNGRRGMRPDSARCSSIQRRIRSAIGCRARSTIRRGVTPSPSIAINLSTFSG